MSLDVESFSHQFNKLQPCKKILVGYSGGRDSHVLLHLLHALHSEYSFELIALHVNHGLQPQANEWAEHCAEICHQLDIELHVERVKIECNNGESLEASARQARYAVYQSYVKNNTTAIALAHHANDQVETVLQQLIRGAGVNGLAGIPSSIAFSQGSMLRPLLSFEQQDITNYAQMHQLRWINDPSNDDVKYDRNFLRHKILPDMYARWPGLYKTLQRVSTHQAEAAELNQVLAKIELASIPHDERMIDIVRLGQLQEARCKNILRYWLKSICKVALPSTTQLQQLVDNALHAKLDATPEVGWSDCIVRRYQNTLYLSINDIQPPPSSVTWDYQQPIQWGGQIIRSRLTVGAGLSLAKISTAELTLQSRRGGEICRPGNQMHRRELKKLFQDWQVPPWQREQVPLVYLDDSLVQVIGYCICHGFEALPGEPGILIETSSES